MNTSLRLSVLLAPLITLAVLAQPPGGSKDTPRADEIKLPADAILVLYDKAADAIRMLPKFVLVSPEKYNALVAEVDRLTKQAQNRQASPVNTWRVTGKVRGNVVELKAVFAFTVEREQTAVTLACSRAQATSVTVDGKVPPLWLGQEGLVVEVEKGDKPDKTAVVEMLIPVREIALGTTPPKTGPPVEPMQGFELDLPLTPVTAVELEMPDGIKTVEVNDQTLGPTLTLSGKKLSGPLGRVSRLKLAWKAPQTQSVAQPLLTSRGRITVSLQGAQVVTEAVLTIQDQGRSARDLQLQIPEKAQVRLNNPSDRERLRADIQGSESPDGRVTIPLAAPSGDPLTVLVTSRRPRVNGAVPLGPFAVIGATTQSGVVWVGGDPDQRVRCVPFHSGRSAFTATPRALDEKGRPEDGPMPAGTIAAFNFWTQAAERVDLSAPWFKLDTDTLVGLLDTKVTHTLELGNAGPADWRLTTLLAVTPVRAEVDQLELDWPSPWLIDRDRGPSPPRIAPGFKEDVVRRVLRLELDPEGLKEFDLEIFSQVGDADARMGALPAVADHPHSSVVLKLPRPRAVRDRGGHKIIIKARDHDLRVSQPANPGLELETQETHRLVYRADPHIDKFVTQVAVAWKPFRPEVRVDSVVDAVMMANEIRLRHQLAYHIEEESHALPSEVLLRVPVEAPRDRFRVLEGGNLSDEVAVEEPLGARRSGRAERLVRCKLEPRAGSIVLLTEYVIPLLAGQRGKDLEPLQRQVSLPLLSAEAATRGQVRVRLWTDPGTRLQPVQGAWEERELEIVPERDRLPSLVLLAQRPASALTLRVEAPALNAAAPPPVLIERALIQVRVTEGGFQHHRARFLLRRINAGTLDLLFPAPLSAIDLQVLFDGTVLDCQTVPSATENDSGEGRKTYLGRVKLPGGSLSRPAALEVVYQLAPTKSGLVSALQSVLHPVAISGVTAGVPLRWQIDLPSGSIALPLDGDAMWRWGRRGWLLAPLPAVNAGDIERWFWGEGDPRAALSDEEVQLVPSHVCWRTNLMPLTLYHVPQQAWLLVCSLLVLVLGLGLSYAAFGSERGRGRLFWGLTALLGLTAAAIGLIWPGLLTMLVYGGQPGLAVLLVILLVQWLLHERYRRRVVFLPGFRRVKTGSSLARKARPEVPTMAGTPPSEEKAAPPQQGRSSAAARVRHEPSTVDAPPVS